MYINISNRSRDAGNDIHMGYDTQQITDRLREARTAKGLSQRDLSKLVGVPQAQISRIEANTVDLRLSSLIAIGRALDLEVTLVPRKAVPAVKSIMRQIGDQTPRHSPAIGKALNQIQDAIRAIQIQAPQLPNLEELKRAAAAINAMPVPKDYLKSLRNIRSAVEHITQSHEQIRAATEAACAITSLRNQIAHAIPQIERPDAPRPAYSLDEEDDDA
jgi:transcriptional regulator with XRE-family HTH domain